MITDHQCWRHSLALLFFLGIYSGCAMQERNGESDLYGWPSSSDAKRAISGLIVGKGSNYEAARLTFSSIQQGLWNDWHEGSGRASDGLRVGYPVTSRDFAERVWILWDVVIPLRVRYHEYMDSAKRPSGDESGQSSNDLFGAYVELRRRLAQEVAKSIIFYEDARAAYVQVATLSGRLMVQGREDLSLQMTLERLMAATNDKECFTRHSAAVNEWLQWNAVLEEVYLAAIFERMTGKRLQVRWSDCMDEGFHSKFLEEVREVLTGMDKASAKPAAKATVASIVTECRDQIAGSETDVGNVSEFWRRSVLRLDHNSLSSNILKRPPFFAK